jgi:maltooligosyltrehalose trehalohydrolase
MASLERSCSACFGATRDPAGVRFRVWAPAVQRLAVRLERGGEPPGLEPLERGVDGVFEGVVAARAGDRYRYVLDEAGAFPDPASRFQPDGVHGPSEIIDPSTFEWTDAGWPGIDPEAAVIYELHVGTFTPGGTFADAAGRLPYLRDLGVTVVELMPVADFPGDHNWGYDCVALYAPSRAYGRPDDLRRFVDRAHALGLAVHLDVVHNHLGPDGAYLHAYSPEFFTDRHSSPWGAGINLDGPGSACVRDFLIENALHWVLEYHVDGLRLDATHAFTDDSPLHFLEELASRVHAATPDRRVMVVAEDHRNLAMMLDPKGWNLDGVWADDFHHAVRRLLAGDFESYYRDFRGTTAEIAIALEAGWVYQGEWSAHLAQPRGTDPSAVPHHRFVICLQNHDQIGNRAHGDRLHHAIDPAAYRAASTLLLTAPETPLLFMGQEWAASSPFLYFTDHHDELGRIVTAGRRKEFRQFAAFAHEDAVEAVPDPQAPGTVARSRLVWDELAREPHAQVLRLYKALLRARRKIAAGRRADRAAVSARALDQDTVSLEQQMQDGSRLVTIARLRGAGEARLPAHAAPAPARVERVLTTEDREFTSDPAPIAIEHGVDGLRVAFRRPGAVLLGIAP